MSAVLELACGGSVEYVPHTAAMVASVLDHSAGLDVRVHYLHHPDLSARDRDRFTRFVEEAGGQANLIAMSADRIAGLPGVDGRLPPMMWYRIYLPELLPDTERVLYLDADTLVLDSLEPLWATPMNGNHIAAVSNVWEPWNMAYSQSLGLPKPYFNSGVIIFDLDLMRRDDTARTILAYARANADKLLWGDQDALNIILGGSRVELHPRWNVMNSVLYFDHAPELFGAEAVAEARTRPGIRHFEGPSINKPWHYLCEWEGRELYVDYRARTPWPRVRREGITPVNVAKRVRRALAASRNRS